MQRPWHAFFPGPAQSSPPALATEVAKISMSDSCSTPSLPWRGARSSVAPKMEARLAANMIGSLLCVYRALFFGLPGVLKFLAPADHSGGNVLSYRFEDYELDAAKRELRRGGCPVALAPKVFDLLLFLIENRERVVSKDDLIAGVWNGRIVSDAALTTRINA